MKRFVATEIWAKPWFQDLAPHLKCLWQYLCASCDCAGVWEMNWKMASLCIGKNVTAEDLKHLAGRVAVFGGKMVVGGFIEFQYGRLSEDCKAHNPIFRTLAKHSLSKGYAEAIHSLKEKEEDQEEEKESETDRGDARGVKPIEPSAFPPELDSQNFRDAWDRWAEYRKQARLKPYTPIGATSQLTQLAKLGSARAIAAIENSIANAYQGIFEPKLQPANNGGKPARYGPPGTIGNPFL